jgi:hypothetical protein
MSGTDDHLWGIILAGGEGRRLQHFIRMHYGSDRPKQYYALRDEAERIRLDLARFGMQPRSYAPTV